MQTLQNTLLLFGFVFLKMLDFIGVFLNTLDKILYRLHGWYQGNKIQIQTKLDFCLRLSIQIIAIVITASVACLEAGKRTRRYWNGLIATYKIEQKYFVNLYEKNNHESYLFFVPVHALFVLLTAEVSYFIYLFNDWMDQQSLFMDPVSTSDELNNNVKSNKLSDNTDNDDVCTSETDITMQSVFFTGLSCTSQINNGLKSYQRQQPKGFGSTKFTFG